MTLKILFWNVNRKDLRSLVCEIAKSTAADAVILLENSMTESETLQKLREEVSDEFTAPVSIPGRFQLFCRGTRFDLEEVYSGNRISMRRLRLSNTELLLGVVYVADKMNWDTSHQLTQVERLSKEVRRFEKKLGHERTILVGDFNMNPFDIAMNLAPGMNAMMTARCIKKKRRVLQKLDYPFFYNPMWSLFGDRTRGPAGTYYHASGSRGIFGWNMLDQVLIRPDAISLFEDVEILTGTGTTSLQSATTRPDKVNASDHFPILVSLSEESHELLA